MPLGVTPGPGMSPGCRSRAPVRLLATAHLSQHSPHGLHLNMLKTNLSPLNAGRLPPSRGVASNYLRKTQEGFEHKSVPSLKFFLEHRRCYNITESFLYVVRYPEGPQEEHSHAEPLSSTGWCWLPSLTAACCPSGSWGSTDP